MSIEFFKPEDFPKENMGSYGCQVSAAHIANAKLVAHGTIVYSSPGTSSWTQEKTMSDTHKAYLVNIQPIEKPKPCEHPVSQVASYKFDLSVINNDSGFKCICGKRVYPVAFSENK